jgi:diguanylate cyclase (GGDEF)-like protein/PAS domain S-box-containing protein
MAVATFCLALDYPPRLVSASDDSESLLGFPREDFLTGAVRLEDRIHPEDAGLVERLFSQEGDRTEGSVNLRIRHSDGRIRCFRARYVKARPEDGPLRLEIFLEDARMISEPGDAAVVAGFKSLIEHTRDYIFLKNCNHVILAAGRNLPNFTEAAQEAAELVGKTDYDLHPEGIADIGYRLESQAMAEGRRVNEIHRINVRDGSECWIDNRKYPVNGPGGEIIGILGIAPDITENIEAAERLRESEESLREAQILAGLGSYKVDIPAGVWTGSGLLDKILGIDRTFERTFGGWLDLVHPDDRMGMNKHLQLVIAGQDKRFDTEYRIVRRNDGSVRWLHARGKVTLDASGRPFTLHGILEDITEMKRTEAALRESKELLQLFIEHAPVGLAMFDREMRYLAASRRWAEDHSTDARGIIGRSHYEVNPEVPERWKETHRRGLAGETQRLEEDRYDRSGGKVEWIRWQITPWRAGDGSIGGIVMFYEDITERKQAEAAMRESKELLQLFIEHAPVGLAMLDREMRYLSVSRRWLEAHCIEGREIIGQSHYEIFPNIPNAWKESHLRVLAGETIPPEEIEWRRRDGSVQWFRREIRPWLTGDDAVGGVIIFTEDITERKQAEERLRLAAMVFTSAREGIMITDPEGILLEVNDAFTRITGYTREEVLGRNPRILQSGLHSRDFYKNMWGTLVREGNWSGELWNRTKGGDLYPEMVNIHAIRDADGKIRQYVGLFTDISDAKLHEQELELAANFDALTGLPNRALFADRLRHAMTQTRSHNHLLAVVCFDLDGFKAINDAYGHSSGDALLAALAQKIRRVLHVGDTLARLGGDEFAAVILDLPDRDSCQSPLARMLAAASEEVAVGDVSLRVTASAGVAFYAQTEEVDADVLLRRAGQALYEAKLAGKNRYRIFDPGRDLLTRSRHEDIDRLCQALAAEEFVLYYQPKVNMRTGKVIGAEALLRWQHPERGLLPPGFFLPVLEDDSLIVDVGQWVIENALNQMEAWQDAGFEIPVSVNVSAFELQQSDFVGNLCGRLEAHPRIKPSNLELEVVETSALKNVAFCSQVLAACREAGVQISVDDFGTGYSSLAYLKRLPANVLKIDQTFVRDMLDEPENLTILKGVLGLAGAFRLQVIAEGVETVDHGLMLLQLGCDFAQGYGIAKPMPARDLKPWAARWQADLRWIEVPLVQGNNREALFALVEHRAWYGHFIAHLQGTRPALPLLSPGQCSVSAWLDAQRLAAGDLSPALYAIEVLHQQLHELATEIHSAHVSGSKQDGLGLLRQLRYLHERYLKRLEPFTRGSTRKSVTSLVHQRDDALSRSGMA